VRRECAVRVMGMAVVMMETNVRGRARAGKIQIGRGGGRSWDCAAIPPLRGPTRQTAARKKMSGRFGRDDKVKKGPTRQNAAVSGTTSLGKLEDE